MVKVINQKKVTKSITLILFKTKKQIIFMLL